MEALLSCKDILFSFATKKEKTADAATLQDISLGLYPGEVFGLVGESGCGKSTLARVLMGLYPPSSGDVLYKGESLYCKRSSKEKRLFYQSFYRNVRMVFQDPFASLNPRMKIIESVLEPLLCLYPEYSKKAAKDECLRMLERVGIDPSYATRYPHEFSGGQRQRITIARALVGKPECLICDEPSSALDVSIQAQILNLLLDLRDDFSLSCLCISHDLAVIEQLSDRVGVMYAGRLVEEFPSSLLTQKVHHPYTQALLSASLLQDEEEITFDAVVREKEITDSEIHAKAEIGVDSQVSGKAEIGVDSQVSGKAEIGVEAEISSVANTAASAGTNIAASVGMRSSAEDIASSSGDCIFDSRSVLLGSAEKKLCAYRHLCLYVQSECSCFEPLLLSFSNTKEGEHRIRCLRFFPAQLVPAQLVPAQKNTI